jgi:hypothetical protein
MLTTPRGAALAVVTAPGRTRSDLSQGVREGKEALRIRHINGIEVRKKRPRGFK